MTLENLYSVDEAARKLGGLSKWTIYDWLSDGRILKVKLGSRTMIRESELNRVISEGLRDSGKQVKQEGRRMKNG